MRLLIFNNTPAVTEPVRVRIDGPEQPLLQYIITTITTTARPSDDLTREPWLCLTLRDRRAMSGCSAVGGAVTPSNIQIDCSDKVAVDERA